jgi:hypothetical protein
MKYLYRLADGYRDSFRGVSAQVVARELERIRREHGRLLTETVVDEAATKTCPLHSVIFYCEDKEAARAHRFSVARQLIRSIVVVRSEVAEPEPVFVHVTLGRAGDGDGSEHYYQSSRLIINNASELQAAISESQKRLHTAETSLAALLRIAKNSRHVRVISGAQRHVQKAARHPR